jgi:hypothetical protein
MPAESGHGRPGGLLNGFGEKLGHYGLAKLSND